MTSPLDQFRASREIDRDILAKQQEVARAAIRTLLLRGSMMALANAGRLSREQADEVEFGLRQAMKLLIELEHGHATPEYKAAIAAEKAKFVL